MLQPEPEGKFTHIMEWKDGRLFRKVSKLMAARTKYHDPFFVQVEPNCFCCKTRLEECDGHGVDVQARSLLMRLCVRSRMKSILGAVNRACAL